MCQHRNLHKGRFDGSTTVCLDCRSPVKIMTTIDLDGGTYEAQCARAYQEAERAARQYEAQAIVNLLAED